MKTKFGYPRIPMLGMVVGRGTRTVQPGKAQALRDWPEPTKAEHVVSLRAFANYLRAFIPNFLEIDQHLKNITKKGMTFDVWKDLHNPETGQGSMWAIKQLKSQLCEQVEYRLADYAAAQDPESGRPLQLFVDACDYGWGCTLAQPTEKGGTPAPIAIFSKSFNPTEQAWSTFEREFCGIRDALKATEHLTKGFPVVLYTDHKNNLFTDSLVGGKKIQKKLVRWSLEVDEMASKVTRVWLKGEDNILGDAPSRNVKDRVKIQYCNVPGSPTKKCIEAMFKGPITDGWGNTRVATVATTEINRQEFGVTWSASLDSGGLVVSDEVAIEIKMEFVQAKGE